MLSKYERNILRTYLPNRLERREGAILFNRKRLRISKINNELLEYTISINYNTFEENITYKGSISPHIKIETFINVIECIIDANGTQNNILQEIY